MNQPLNQEHAVVTGDVPGMTRAQAQQAAADLGAKVTSGLTAKTTLVIAGPGAGSKLDKAKQQGLRILPADDFAVLVADPRSWDGKPVGAISQAPAVDPGGDSDRQAQRALKLSHPAGDVSYTRNGQWVVIYTCRCGWRTEAPQRREALNGHRDHWLEHNPGQTYPWENGSL